jgi:hypothetical protein
LKGFRFRLVGVIGGRFGVVEIGVQKGAGVVEVRLVDGGLGRIGLVLGLSPLLGFFGRDIGEGGRTDRLERLGQRRWLVPVLERFGGGFGLSLVIGRFGRRFEPLRAGLLDHPFSLRRVAVDF